MALDQVYQAKSEHISGTDNTGAGGLSRLHMHDEILDSLLQEVCAINELDHETNIDFPLDMARIREEQDCDEKLQGLIQSKARDIAVTTIGNTEDILPPSLQTQIID